MKGLYAILIFFFVDLAAQDDFFAVYAKIKQAALREQTVLENDKKQAQEILKKYGRDTVAIKAELKESYRQHKKKRSDSLIALAREVIHLTFPDINFTDLNNKAWAISDFSGRELIINYNYMYCAPCLYRIDSTLKYLGNRKTQLIVLFLSVYQKDIGDLKSYGDNVTIGFISDDTAELISLAMGDNSMYYLDENRRIECFDRSSQGDHELAWVDFLKTYGR